AGGESGGRHRRRAGPSGRTQLSSRSRRIPPDTSRSRALNGRRGLRACSPALTYRATVPAHKAHLLADTRQVTLSHFPAICRWRPELSVEVLIDINGAHARLKTRDRG